MILVTGGSASGKSAFAEKLLTERSSEGRTYLATMNPAGKEAAERIARHRKMREGAGFTTVECPVHISDAASLCGRAVLLEDLGNLVANEMFCEALPKKSEIVTEKIISGVEQLNCKLKHLVIVTNNVFEDGVLYDELTMEYIRAMGLINRRLAAKADKVIEVVVGIPVIVKEGK